MLLAGSDCCRTLDEIAEDCEVMGDVEEGEISDATSVEEITEEDFKKQDNKKSNSSSEERKQTVSTDGVVAGGKGGNDANSRVWTMRELLNNYPAYRNYASARLHSHAWAQAVLNKPLNEVLGMEVDSDGNSKGSLESSKSKEGDHIVIDDSGEEKEEGELEEGEIDLECEPVVKVSDEITNEPESGNIVGDPMIADNAEGDTKEQDLENKVKCIRGILESTSMLEAQKSFEEVSSRLLSAIESLKELVLENDSVPKKDILVQLAFAALQTINSVFSSMNYISKERNKATVSRLISIVENHFSQFLSLNQMKEMETMRQSLYMNKLPAIGDIPVKNNLNLPSEAQKHELSNLRNRAPLLPLLDLHKDHDLDSLPSPTRETTPLPVNNSIFATMQNKEEAKINPYGNDAFKVVSTYQQKFGRAFGTDNLPSPTPSEEANDANGDTEGEISSSFLSNSKPLNMLIGETSVSPSNLNSTDLARLNAALNVSQSSLSASAYSQSSVSSQANPQSSVSCPANPQSSVSTQTMKSSAKSRDPRLRFVNSESTASDANLNLLNNTHNNSKVESSGGVTNSRKQNRADDTFTYTSASKRQKNGLEYHEAIRDGHKAQPSGGWLEDIELAESSSQSIPKAETDIRKMENGTTYLTSGNATPVANVTMGEQAPMTASTTVSLPFPFKDVAVNPTMLINLLKMGQKQKVTQSTRQKPTDPRKAAQLPGSSSISGPTSSTAMPVKTLQVSSLAISSNEPTKIHMKPRDPRRVLHVSTLQRTGSLVEEQIKSNEPALLATQGIKNKTEGQAETKTLSSQLVPRQDVLTGKSPDIAPQFTKSLQSIASLVAVSQLSSAPIVPENSVSPTVQLKAERDTKPLTSVSGHQNAAGSAPGTSASGPANPQGSWGDIEHLFEGYDDKQKAAIQRERARRLEEQKKMFAARKLCLVLDLDHTLLNSAKFAEVEPVHDEILRRKEEQDRGKAYRHLFWFPHMSMWTKLRPGIWNFLEKASKLYELHLYTMGNKLYATEMAKVLDPKGTLFNGRVISRGDDGDISDGDERVPKSKDLEGVLGMESGVVIIDDSVRVWPHNKMNLIAVERYTYFPCSRRQFGLSGPSLLEIDHDERPEAGTLASSLAVIERIHQNFFSHASLDEADVRNILASEQRKILAGCRIVFSRVFPVGEANPHHHPLWQTAQQFGAVCTNQVDEQVTHVVAISRGTDKVHWAITKGRFVVHPGWVEASALLYRRADENDFAIKS